MGIVSLPARGQGRVERLARWGGAVVAGGKCPRVLDVVQGTSAPVTVPGLDVVHSVGGEAVRFAGGLRWYDFAVMREQGGTWEALPLPRAMRDAPGGRRIAVFARGEALAVTWYGHEGSSFAAGLEWWSGRRWQSVPVGQGPMGGVPEHVLVSEEELVFGYSQGEWGGSVWRATRSGEVTEVPSDRLPVQGLLALSGGRVLIGTGLAHMTFRRAHVGVLGEGLKTLVRVDERQRIGWNLGPDSLEGLAIDAQERPCLLTSSNGVLRLEERGLVSVTPGWPPTEPLYSGSLLIEDELAVIGTYDRGVLLWKLGTSEVRRIGIPR